MKNTEFTLKKKLTFIGIALLVLAMISISFILWVTWKLESGAAAINEAGRMRMQTYQLALLVGEGNKEASSKLIKKFDDSISVLKYDDPSRPLFVPWNAVNRAYFGNIANQWNQIKDLLLVKKTETIPVSQIDNFVSNIDRFVGSIEGQVDY